MQIEILKDIVIIFALSTGVNLLFTRFKIPTVVGYLITGIIAGPHLLSLVSSKHEIEVLAEIGVALLLFTIGMEFSMKHLLKIRRIVFLGGFLQVIITAGIFYLVSNIYKLDWKAGVFIGFLAALSSSALVLKILQERSELSSNYGRTVLGILIFQDLLLVPLLLFANILSDTNINLTNELFFLTIKAAGIILLVYAGNKWLLPKLLHKIALTKNQELFLMSIFLICFTIALLTSELGMSVAFGAFLAGLMISDSEYSHNAFASLLPFKDTFTSFFFVSVGMLLDVNFVLSNPMLVIGSVLMVVLVKTLIAGGTGFILGHTFKGTVLVGLALCQVGEFSFILAKIGNEIEVFPNFFYQLFLAVTVVTMAITPFLMQLSIPFSNLLLKLPLPSLLVKGLFPLNEIEIPEMKNHIVIIGKDASAIKLSGMASYYNMQHVSIIFDPSIVKEKLSNGEHVIYGDAVNEPILRKAYVENAEIIVVSVGSIIPSMAIIEKVRLLNKNAKILARTHRIQNVSQLYKIGADEVLPEKLEISLDLFHRILTGKLIPSSEITQMLVHLRNINLGEYTDKDTVNKLSIFDELSDTSISAIKIEPNCFAIDETIENLKIRKKIGTTLLAIKREGKIIEHPTPDTVLKTNDIIYVLGNPEQLNNANKYFSNTQV